MQTPFWARSEQDPDSNREMLKYLETKGYRFSFNETGYRVWFKDEYLHGAGSIIPPTRWRNKIASSKMYLFQAVTTAHDHYTKPD